MHYTLLVKPIHGLISRGEAIRDKPAQYNSMRARVSVRVVPNMESLPWLQIADWRSRLGGNTGFLSKESYQIQADLNTIMAGQWLSLVFFF